MGPMTGSAGGKGTVDNPSRIQVYAQQVARRAALVDDGLRAVVGRQDRWRLSATHRLRKETASLSCPDSSQEVESTYADGPGSVRDVLVHRELQTREAGGRVAVGRVRLPIAFLAGEEAHVIGRDAIRGREAEGTVRVRPRSCIRAASGERAKCFRMPDKVLRTKRTSARTPGSSISNTRRSPRRSLWNSAGSGVVDMITAGRRVWYSGVIREQESFWNEPCATARGRQARPPCVRRVDARRGLMWDFSTVAESATTAVAYATGRCAHRAIVRDFGPRRLASRGTGFATPDCSQFNVCVSTPYFRKSMASCASAMESRSRSESKRMVSTLADRSTHGFGTSTSVTFLLS